MHQGPTVQGINTAATLWTTASLGLAAGAGYYALTVMIFLAVLVVQFPLQWGEHGIGRLAGTSRPSNASASHSSSVKPSVRVTCQATTLPRSICLRVSTNSNALEVQ